jgi:hypothetical protein
MHSVFIIFGLVFVIYGVSRLLSQFPAAPPKTLQQQPPPPPTPPPLNKPKPATPYTPPPPDPINIRSKLGG